MSRPHIVADTASLSVLLVYFVLTGCHSSSKNSTPTVAFSKIAAAYQESPYKTDITERDYKTDIIDGRVTGTRPGQRIVLYAKTDGRWGLCRQSGQPFTNIESDGRWKASVHLGLRYAALLVDPTYNPPEQTESLPVVGNGVVALAVVNGDGPPAVVPSPKTLNFSGYGWTTSAGPIFRAGSRNFFDPAKRLDGRKRYTAPSHFGKSGKVGCGGGEAHAQPGIRNLQVPGARCLSSRTFCSSNANHLGRRWHREHPARVGR
jgi:hypothetical protein